MCPSGVVGVRPGGGIARVPVLLRRPMVWRFSQPILPPLSHSEVSGEEESSGVRMRALVVQGQRTGLGIP